MPNQEDSILPNAPPNDRDVENEDEESSNSGHAAIDPSDTFNDPAKTDVKLEDLFNDDDDEDDDEFPSSGPTTADMPSSPPAAPV